MLSTLRTITSLIKPADAFDPAAETDANSQQLGLKNDRKTAYIFRERETPPKRIFSSANGKETGQTSLDNFYTQDVAQNHAKLSSSHRQGTPFECRTCLLCAGHHPNWKFGIYWKVVATSALGYFQCHAFQENQEPYRSILNPSVTLHSTVWQAPICIRPSRSP